MTEQRLDLIAKLIVAITHAIVWFATVLCSAWLEWHGQHEHAIWLLLLLCASSLCWLKSIEMNTDRIPKKP